jgi:polyisoprenoid-binding protein YceI
MTTTAIDPTLTTTWQIDPTHVNVEFAVRHLMISTVKGRFSDVRGTVTLNGDDLRTAAVDVTIGVESIDTREAQRDAHLRSADFFDVARYPTLTFKSRRVDAAGPGRFRVIGDLTIHGVTREVGLEVEEEGRGRDPWGNQRAGFSARATISRKQFGLTWNQLLETGGVAVGDEVRIVVDVELVQQALAA